MPNDSIIDFPTNPYTGKLADMERSKSLGTVFDCLKYAIEQNMGRAPIANFLSSNANQISSDGYSHRRLVEWIADHCIYAVEVSMESSSTQPNDERERSPEFDSVLKKAYDMGRALAEKGSMPYRWFTPGWEVDSPLWSEIFGNNDPAITIADYADQMFDGPGPNDYLYHARTPLTADDLSIIKILLPLISAETEKDFPNAQESSPGRNCKIAAAIKRVLFKDNFADDVYHAGSFQRDPQTASPGRFRGKGEVVEEGLGQGPRSTKL